TALGEAEVEGKAVVGVRVSSKGHEDISLYFDKKTYLLTKTVFRATEKNGNEANDERIVAEYTKDKNGVPVPKKVVMKRGGGEVMELDVTEFTYLEKLDDNEFKK